MAKVLVKATNRVQDVSGEELQSGLLDGSLALIPGQEIRVQTNPTRDDPSSRGGTFSDYNLLGEALRSGRVRIQSAQEAARAEAADRPVQTFLESAVPFGVGRAASAAAEALTADPRLENPADTFQQGLENARLRREENPVAGVAGEISGTIAQTFIPGTAASLAARAGQATEGVLARAVASRAAQLAAGSAVEGVGFSLLHSLDELALGDPELSAERVISDVGVNALLGGVLGGVLGAGGQLARRLRNVRGGERETAQLLSRANGEAPQPLLVRAMDKVRRLVTRSRDPEDVLRRMADDASLRARIIGRNEVRDQVSRTLASSIDDSERLTRRITEEAVGQLKSSRVSQIVRRGNEESVETSARQLLSRIEQRVDEAMNLPNQHDRGIIERLRGSIRRTTSRLDDARSDSARMFEELDSLKRNISPEAKFGRGLENSSPAVQRAAQLADDIYHDIRANLESVDLYGEAGTLQQRVNAGWSSLLNGSGSNIRGQFMRRMGFERGRPVYSTDPGKVQTYLNQMSRPRNDLRHASLQQRLQAQEELAGAIGEFYELTPAAREALDSLKQNNSTMRQTIRQMEDTVSAQNAFREILQSERQTAVSHELIRGSVAAAVGGIAGGPPLAAVGGALGAVSTFTRPATLINSLHTLEAVATRGTERVAKAARAAVRDTARKVPKSTARRVGLLAGISSRDQDSAQELTTQLQALALNPARLQETLAQATEGLGAPSMSAHMQMKAGTVLAAMLREMPVQGRTYDLLGAPASGLDESELHSFAEFARGATDPAVILDDIMSGEVSPRAVQAVKELWPRLYEDMFDAVIQEIGELQAEGKTIPYNRRLAIGLTFDLPTDPSLEPDAVQMYQKNLAPQEPQPAPSRASDISTQVIKQPGLTTTERIANRRAG